MRPVSLFRRHASAPMIVSSVALFVSLAGAGYAATRLSPNSVGSAQLKKSSVTSPKIANGSVGNFKLAFGSVGSRKMMSRAVGKNQINADQVQARVSGTCGGIAKAIQSIGSSGTVGCMPTPPQEFGTSTISPVTLSTGSTPIAAESLPTGSSYLVFANPRVNISGTVGQPVEVDCTLFVSPVNGVATSSRIKVELGSHQQAGTIPLVLPIPAVSGFAAVAVSCTESFSGTVSPTVTVSTGINAIQTAHNN
jgi:hypothetical protein